MNNKIINQNTARSCENPLKETDGEIFCLCTLRIDPSWVWSGSTVRSFAIDCMMNTGKFSVASNELRFWTNLNHHHFASHQHLWDNGFLSSQKKSIMLFEKQKLRWMEIFKITDIWKIEFNFISLYIQTIFNWEYTGSTWWPESIVICIDWWSIVINQV